MRNKGDKLKYIGLNIRRDEYEPYQELIKEYGLGVEGTFVMTDNEPKIYVDGKTTIHGPYLDLFPGIGDINIQEIYLNRLVEAYEKAKSVNANGMVCHAHYLEKAFFPEIWLENSAVLFLKLLDHIDSKFTIFIENVYEAATEMIKQLIIKSER